MSASLLIGVGAVTAADDTAAAEKPFRFSFQEQAQEPTKKLLPRITDDNPIEIGIPIMNRTGLKIMNINDIDFHDKNKRANFTLKIGDAYGEKEYWRVSKIRGMHEIKVLTVPGGRMLFGLRAAKEVNEIVPLSPELADYIDEYIWIGHEE